MNPNNILIALDDGHGMETSGKRTPMFPDGAGVGLEGVKGNYMHENEFNRAVVAILDIELKRCGFKTLLVAPTDIDTPLSTRTKLANSAKANLYVSVHANAMTGQWGNARGIETFHYTQASASSIRAAQIIHKHMLGGTQLLDRGVKSANFQVLRETNMPSVLVECAFMDNLAEAKLLLSDTYRRECAIEMAKGICEIYDTPYVLEKQNAVKAYTPLLDKKDSKVLHERIMMSGSNLVYMNPSKETWAIKNATDVRLLKLNKSSYTLKLVWEKGQKVSDLVRKYGADYGFNFPFFWEGMPVADCKIGSKVLGTGYDKINGAQMTKWHGFSYSNGQPKIGQVSLGTELGADGFLVKTTPLLLNGKGEEVWDWYRNIEGTAKDIGKDANGVYVSCQRTFIGIDALGNLLIGISDGRGSVDKGLTLQEMAKYMKDHGAVWALNGDGGGSTILANKDGGLNQSANTGSNERVGGHAVLVFLNKAEAPKPIPEAPKQYWRVHKSGVQSGAFLTGEAAEQHAKALYRQDPKQLTIVTNPDGSAYYTPSLHPEDFPDLIIDKLDEATQKAILVYLQGKFK